MDTDSIINPWKNMDKEDVGEISYKFQIALKGGNDLTPIDIGSPAFVKSGPQKAQESIHQALEVIRTMVTYELDHHVNNQTIPPSDCWVFHPTRGGGIDMVVAIEKSMKYILNLAAFVPIQPGENATTYRMRKREQYTLIQAVVHHELGKFYRSRQEANDISLRELEASFGESFTDLEKEVTFYRSDRVESMELLKEKDDEISSLQKEMTTLEEETSSLKGQMTTLVDATKTKDDEIAALKAEIASFGAEQDKKQAAEDKTNQVGHHLHTIKEAGIDCAEITQTNVGHDGKQQVTTYTLARPPPPRPPAFPETQAFFPPPGRTGRTPATYQQPGMHAQGTPGVYSHGTPGMYPQGTPGWSHQGTPHGTPQHPHHPDALYHSYAGHPGPMPPGPPYYQDQAWMSRPRSQEPPVKSQERRRDREERRRHEDRRRSRSFESPRERHHRHRREEPPTPVNTPPYSPQGPLNFSNDDDDESYGSDGR